MPKACLACLCPLKQNLPLLTAPLSVPLKSMRAGVMSVAMGTNIGGLCSQAGDL